MKEFSIVFTKSKKKFAIGSFLIRWYTKKEYSHVARELVLHEGKVVLFYQASEGRVNYECKEVFDTHHEIVTQYKLSICDTLYNKISVECLLDAGKKYGFWQNIGIMLVNYGICEDNPWKEGRNCSELVYTTVFKPMMPWLTYNPDTITPCDIECIINKNMHLSDNNCWILNN